MECGQRFEDAFDTDSGFWEQPVPSQSVVVNLQGGALTIALPGDFNATAAVVSRFPLDLAEGSATLELASPPTVATSARLAWTLETWDGLQGVSVAIEAGQLTWGDRDFSWQGSVIFDPVAHRVLWWLDRGDRIELGASPSVEIPPTIISVSTTSDWFTFQSLRFMLEGRGGLAADTIAIESVNTTYCLQP